jgi:hypothetical protein
VLAATCWVGLWSTCTGHISGKEAAIYMDAMQMSGRTTVAADRIAAGEFIAACMADVFKNANT